MMHSAFAPAPLPGNPQADTADTEYEPGICNIGPAEVARRLRAGHVGLVATLGLYTGLTMIGAPRLARLLVALPAAGAKLQPRLEVSGRRARDRSRATQIGLASLGIGVAVGVVAVVLPR